MRINIPPFTRILLGLLISLSLVYQAASLRTARREDTGSAYVLPWISLTPQYSVYYPWVYATASFAEQNLITMAIGGATLFFGGRYLERAWGSKEYITFILVATLVPNLIAALLYIFAFVLTRSDSVALVSIQGSIAIQAAFLVAFKQLVPEHTVTILKGVIKFRVKHFPAIFLVANTISGVVFFTDTAAILSWLGILSSWTYLRFYKAQQDLSGGSTGGSYLRGDASETFSFASFWPDVVQGPIEMVSNAVFNIFVLAKICTPFSEEEVENSKQAASARESGLPSLMNPDARYNSGKREEAERRRKLALKALDQRLQAAAATRVTPPVAQAVPSSGEPATSIVDQAGNPSS